MNTVWITYAWDDNKGNDIDFVAQELENSGVSVKLDRWSIEAGKRLYLVSHSSDAVQTSSALKS